MMRALYLAVCLSVLETGFAQLSVTAILDSTDKFYPRIQAAREEVVKTEGDFLAVQGKFDPQLGLHQRSNPAGGYKNYYIDNELRIPTLWNGLQLFGGYRIGRGNFQVWDQYYLTNSGGESRVGFELPLLRNFTIDQSRTDLLTAQRTIAFARAQTDNIRLQSWQEAIVLYWVWVDTGLKLKVYKDLLSLAKERQSAIEKQVTQGDLAKIDAVENRQFIFQRRQLLNQAKLQFEQAAINLSMFYRNDKGQPIQAQQGNLPFLHQLKHRLSHLPAAISSTINLDAHPALRQLNILYGINTLRLKLARNERLPILNLETYTSKDTGRGDPRKDPRAARVGLHFHFPLYQREARGKILKGLGEQRRLETQKTFSLNTLQQSFDRLVVSQKRLHQQYRLASEQLKMAKVIQRAEYRRFKMGGSSLFLVNQWEQNTAQASLSLIDTLTGFYQSHDLIKYFLLPQRVNHYK